MAASPPNPGRDHIVILGASKTGTTGLYSSVKRGLRNAGIEAQTVFEPKSAAPLDTLFRLAPGTPVMTKTTLNAVDEVLPDPLVWDRRVMTVRDPRDMLISALLFRPLTRRSLERTDKRTLEQFLEVLERKEADPSSVSVSELFLLARDLRIGSRPFNGLRRALKRQQVLLEQFAFHPVRYENFVLGKIDDLSEYLGFPVENVRDTKSAVFGHISRSATSGEFTRWFRPDDLAFFNNYFSEALATFGYERDAQLALDEKIDSATASQYIRDRYHERRSALRTAVERRGPEWSPTDVRTRADFDTLIDYATDGDPVAALRVAEVEMSGHLAESDLEVALRWARRSAQRGLQDGMRMTIDLLTRLDSDAPAAHRERRIWQSTLLERNHRVESDRRRIVSLKEELESVRRSERFRVGSLVVTTRPRRASEWPKSIRRVARLWRRRRGWVKVRKGRTLVK